MNTAQQIAAAGFDIANLTTPSDPTNPVTFNVDLIFNDDGEAVAGLTIVGKNSQEYRTEHHAIRAEGYQKSARRKSAIDATTDEGADRLVTSVDENNARLALAVAVGWYGFTSGPAKVPFDKALIVAAYKKYPTWQEKVLAALEVDSNFLKVSSPASSPTPATNSPE